MDINTLLVSGSRRLKTRTAIADVLAPVWRNGKTIVIMDTAPSLSAIQVSALAASDWLIIPAGGFRKPTTEATRRREELPDGNRRGENDFFMDGAGVFTFTQTDVPPTIQELFDSSGVAMESVVEERVVREIIPQLKKAGAEGIIELPLNKIIP